MTQSDSHWEKVLLINAKKYSIILLNPRTKLRKKAMHASKQTFQYFSLLKCLKRIAIQSIVYKKPSNHK